MASTKLNPLAIAIITSLPIIQFLSIDQSNAATKTPTKTIIVPVEEPEEKPAENPVPTIPDDALPNVDTNAVGAEEDTVDPADDETPAALPTILRDVELLPAAVRATHSTLVNAAKQGEMEALRELIGTGETATSLSIGGLEGDPIAFLKETSGDDDGYELLAILQEVLEAGFVHVDAGAENEMYIWPYFFTWPFEKLTPPMKVELYRILTAGDVQDSTDFGGYIFYRIGIRPDGKWEFFVAGD